MKTCIHCRIEKRETEYSMRQNTCKFCVAFYRRNGFFPIANENYVRPQTEKWEIEKVKRLEYPDIKLIPIIDCRNPAIHKAITTDNKIIL